MTDYNKVIQMSTNQMVFLYVALLNSNHPHLHFDNRLHSPANTVIC